jgi:glycosyltransferase involved in cell wall biosynthesis
MATFNGAKHVGEQLASLARQQRLPDELVVCDDGSTDGTVEQLEAFAQSAPFRMRVHRNARNLGVLRNFEKALSLCGGDIVFLCDQDDVWFPEKIADVVVALEGTSGILLVINDKLIADENLVPTGATMLGSIRAFGSPDSNFVAGCCVALRREWLEVALPIPNGAIDHDRWLVGLAHHLKVISILERPLQFYRRHGANVSHDPFSDRRRVGLATRLTTEVARILRRSSGGDEEGWQLFMASNEAELRRIAERRHLLGQLGLADRVDPALDLLRRRGETLAARERMTSMTLPRRAMEVWKLWRSGGYTPFSGWRSALKDVLR